MKILTNSQWHTSLVEQGPPRSVLWSFLILTTALLIQIDLLTRTPMEGTKFRNRYFHPKHEPFGDHTSSQRQYHICHITGSLSWMNPTHGFSEPLSLDRARHRSPSELAYNKGAQEPHERLVIGDVRFHWRPRDNRKGRHALQIVNVGEPAKGVHIVPRRTSSWWSTLRGIHRMVTAFPYWDVSYLTAVIFTIGSVVWVVNAFFVWLPLARPSAEFKGEILVAGGISAFVGATIFELGSFFLILEAVNKNAAGCFGWALEDVLTEDGKMMARFRPDLQACIHHHANKRSLIGRGKTEYVSEEPGKLDRSKAPSTSDSFRCIPPWEDLQSHYIYEIGFLASLAQLLGATIFWISGFTALPGINNHLSKPVADAVYRAPQVVGGCGFIFSGALFMLESQPNWYTPAPRILGWHVGLWNLIGAIGFTLSGIFLFPRHNSGMEFQASLATFWGSWAFLIGSVIQWYESLDKYPVEEAPRR